MVSTMFHVYPIWKRIVDRIFFSDGFGSYHVEGFIIFHEWLLALWLMPIYTPSIWGGWDVSVWIFVVTFFSIIRQFLKQVNLLVQQGSCGGCLNLKYLAVCLEGFCLPDAFHGRRFEACWSWVCPGEVRFYEGGGDVELLLCWWLNNY